MENVNQDPVDQSQSTSGDEKNDVVSYESYKKALNEKKNFQSKLSEYEQELQRLRAEKMSAEGKKDELIQTYKKQLSEISEKLEKTNKHYAWNTLTGAIKQEAIKHGCTDPEKLIRLMDDEDLRSIEIGENFNIDFDSVKNVIEKSKKDNFFLFKSPGKPIANGIPNTKIVEDKKDLKDLSIDELKALYKGKK